ncbi:hypothetical protein BN946_scf184798.g46 [Trametes cinnabarina]|uniref:Uncharacterized protein n=1 Tax=Pycnoporus cinnabarinus TaxID=5643 RepID=A0A060S907_PYCCI|nr:hypothetical protein BN946_scf184798.g46 [Trametes cinnabarina]
MDSKDIQENPKDHGVSILPILTPNTKQRKVTRTGTSSPVQQPWPHTQLVAYKQWITDKWMETYPWMISTLYRITRLCFLSVMVIFVVFLASWFMALSHWFTIVLGHLVLRYTMPRSVDDAFVKGRIDYTMIFAAVGALIVNCPPFIIFLVSFPFTFDRSTVEGGTASANAFIKRITPKNRHILLFLQYAPRLAAAPVGCVIVSAIEADNHIEPGEILTPLHAALAGLTGEVVLTASGRLKGWLFSRNRRQAERTDSEGQILPMTTSSTS